MSIEGRVKAISDDGNGDMLSPQPSALLTFSIRQGAAMP